MMRLWGYFKGPQATSEEPKATSDVFDKPWREINWSKQRLVEELREFELFNPQMKHLRVLMTGPVGAGKSSFVNSINSAFQNRITNKAIMATSAESSCTKMYNGYKIKNGKSGSLSFMLYDTMGIENKDNEGIHPNDLKNALCGHLPDKYKFNNSSSMSPEDAGFISKPPPEGKTHCLVCAVSGNTISQLDNETVKKIRETFREASKYGMSQVIIMTNIDEVCPLVKNDLKKVYLSKKIKEKMKECSNTLSVPMTCIFPVKNYHEEIETKDDLDVLLLSALKHILHFADDFTEEL